MSREPEGFLVWDLPDTCRAQLDEASGLRGLRVGGDVAGDEEVGLCGGCEGKGDEESFG